MVGKKCKLMERWMDGWKFRWMTDRCMDL